LVPGSKLSAALSKRQAATSRATRTATATASAPADVIVVSDSEDSSAEEPVKQQKPITSTKRTLARRNVNAVFSPFHKAREASVDEPPKPTENRQHETPDHVEGYVIPTESLVIAEPESPERNDEFVDEETEFFTPKTLRKSLRLAPPPEYESKVDPEPLDTVQEELECKETTPPGIQPEPEEEKVEGSMQPGPVGSQVSRKSMIFRSYQQEQPIEVINPAYSPKVKRLSVWPKRVLKLVLLALIATLCGSLFVYSSPQVMDRLPFEVQLVVNLALQFVRVWTGTHSRRLSTNLRLACVCELPESQVYDKQVVFGVAGAVIAVLVTAVLA
jgi:hypothetical protein